MTKTLTEQWREGTLKGGIYYLLLKDGTTVIDEPVYIVGEKQLRWRYSSFDFVKEVIATVPSYEEYNELLRYSELSRNLLYEVLVNQKEYNELLDKAKEYKRLQEQLKEANYVIIKRMNQDLEWEGGFDEDCINYADKYGIELIEGRFCIK